jgi:predicted 2-oxoglutarate/Fe(II)-dependent dioxygenase YbiX
MSLFVGAPAPQFNAPSKINPNFAFGSVAGRYILLAFLPGSGPDHEAAMRAVNDHLHHFDDDQRLFFGILPDAASYEAAPDAPPLRWFLDRDGEVRRLYHAVDAAGDLAPCWVLIDPSLRILGAAPLARGAEVLAALTGFGAPKDHAGIVLHAPVLIVPRIFEPDFCRRLIEVYRDQGGRPSGTMLEVEGRTVGVADPLKRRRDATIEDPGLLAQIRSRLGRRLLPEIEKAFGFNATRIERHIVACYDATEGGFFRAHRDNCTPGTAHRRFATSINLNAEDFEGGELRFPEFGPRTYKPPTGGAVVFSCSLLHEALPVTRGTRYAYLPFFYDEAGQAIRDANLHTFEPAPVGQTA